MKSKLFSVSLFGAVFAASAVPLFAEPIPSASKSIEVKSIICSEITQKDERCITLSFFDRTGRVCDLSENAVSLVKITPSVPDMDVKFTESNLILTGNFLPETLYEIRIVKGFRSKLGSVPLIDPVMMIRTKSQSPLLRFLSDGIYYPLNSKNFVLPFEARKVKEYQLNIYRMYDNIPDMETDLYYYNARSYGETITAGEMIPIPTAAAGTKSVFFNLDLTKHFRGRKPGIYGVEIFDPKRATDEWAWYGRGENRIVVVTDMAASAVTDKTTSQIRIFVRNLSTGLPVDGASVRVLSEKRQIVAEGETKNGEALLRFKPEFSLKKDSLSHAVIRKDGDTTILHLKSAMVLSGNQGIEMSGRPAAFVYAERDIMRPGETIQPAVFVREIREGKSSSLANAPLKFFLIDPCGKAVQTISAQTDANGFAKGKFSVEANAPTGNYRILCGITKEEPFGEFDFYVATFMPDRIHVTMETDTTDVFENEPVIFNSTAKYYFGTEVAEAAWNFSVSFNGVYTPKHFESWTVGTNEKQLPMIEAKAFGQSMKEAKDLRWNGYTNPQNQNTKPVKALVTLSVSEPGGRAVSASRTIICHPSETYIGIRQAETVAGENVKSSVLELIQLPTKAGGTVAEPLISKLKLIRRQWEYNLKKVDSTYTRQWELIETPVKNIPAAQTVGGSPVRVEFKDLPAGEYRLTAESGNRCTEFDFWHSAGEAGMRTQDPNNLVLRMDKAEYLPGETAKIELDVPVAGYVLAVFGEHNSEASIQQECKAGKNTLSIPIRASMESAMWNVAVSLVTGTNSDVKRSFGFLRIPVDQKTRKLNPEVVLPKIARPSEVLNAELRLSTLDGKPAGGVVHVFAVDEGVLSLTGFHVPDIHRAFYGPKHWNARIFDNYGYLYPDFKLLPDGSIGGGERAAALSKNIDEIRFKESALVVAEAVVVPDSGKASVTLKLPNHTGALRVMAVAANTGAAGSNESSIVMREPVSALLSAPNAVNAKDEFELACSVFNHDVPDGEFSATFTLPPQLESKAPLTVSGTLAKNAQKNFTIRCTAKEILGSGDISITMKMGKAVHTETIPLTVRSSAANEIRHVLKVLNPGETGDFTINPKDWIRGKHSLNVSASPAASLPFALNYLNSYPYGCLEQTVSGAFPFLATDNLVKSGMLSSEAAATAKERLSISFSRILSMLRSNGSFTMWPGGSTVWDDASVYAAHFLFEAQAKKMWNPDESVTNSIRSYLRSLLSNWDNSQLYLLKAYACYALAVAGDEAFLEPARNLIRAGELSYPAMIASLSLIRGGYAAEGANSLKTQLEFETWRSSASLCGCSSDTAGYGMTLYLLLDNVPRSSAAWPIAAELAKRLRPDSNAWGGTQANAWAALGLGAFAADFPISKTSDFELISAAKTEKKTFKDSFSIPFTPGETMKLRNTGTSPLPVRLVSEGIPSTLPVTCGPIQVSRTYETEDGTALTHVKHGDLVYIRLTVTAPKAIENLVLCDLLPAGLEIEDERLLSRTAAYSGSNNSTSNALHPKYLEKRFDRFLFFGFCDNNTRSIRYRTRAVTRGTFQLSPCTAEDMYDPDLRGVFSESGVFTVE